MKKKLCALAAAVMMLAAGTAADAQDLIIPGLGKLPFGDKITVTDGTESRIGDWIREGTKTKNYRNTKRAAMERFLYIPPGMELFPEEPPYPYDSLKIYQLRKDTVAGDYTATIYVISGTEEALFRNVSEKTVLFWRNAFRENAERPEGLFGGVKIRTEEFQAALDEALADRKGSTEKVQILSMNMWQPVANHDGTWRWQQEIRGIMSNDRGLSFPFWNQSVLYRREGVYYLMEIRGSHASAQALEKDLLYGLYQLEREKA